MIARRLEACEPDGEGNLRPVPRFVQQDVEEQLAGRRLHRPPAYFEGPHPIRIVARVRCVLLKLPPDRRTVIEQRRSVVPRQPRCFHDRLRLQALKMSTYADVTVPSSWTGAVCRVTLEVKQNSVWVPVWQDLSNYFVSPHTFYTVVSIGSDPATLVLLRETDNK